MRARCDFWNCTFSKGGGPGLQILATVGGGTTTEGNANGWKMFGGACSDNGGPGIFTNGADANAGIATGVSFDNNGTYGTSELSFLGNYYPGCHWASNVTAHVNNSGANNCSFFGHYFEIEGTVSTLAVGSRAEGTGAASVFPGGGALVAADHGGLGRPVITGAGGLAAAVIGGGKTSTSLFDVRSDYPGWLYSHTDFGYTPRWGARPGTGLWAWELTMGSTLWLMGLNGNSGTRYNFGKSAPPNGVLGISGFALGYEGWAPDGKFIAYAANAPTTGDMGTGEFRFFDDPGTKKALGTSCVTGHATTGGTWRKAGALFIDATETYDPPSLAAGAIGAERTVTVTGAALGDYVKVAFSLDTQGIELIGRVSAADTVKYFPRNPTAGVLDLASGTTTIRVEKA
jgi:hypothetical protein